VGTQFPIKAGRAILQGKRSCSQKDFVHQALHYI